MLSGASSAEAEARSSSSWSGAPTPDYLRTPVQFLYDPDGKRDDPGHNPGMCECKIVHQCADENCPGNCMCVMMRGRHTRACNEKYDRLTPALYIKRDQYLRAVGFDPDGTNAIPDEGQFVDDEARDAAIGADAKDFATSTYHAGSNGRARYVRAETQSQLGNMRRIWNWNLNKQHLLFMTEARRLRLARRLVREKKRLTRHKKWAKGEEGEYSDENSGPAIRDHGSTCVSQSSTSSNTAGSPGCTPAAVALQVPETADAEGPIVEKDKPPFLCQKCEHMQTQVTNLMLLQCSSALEQTLCFWNKCVRCYVNAGLIRFHKVGYKCRRAGGLYTEVGVHKQWPWIFVHPFFPQLTSSSSISEGMRWEYRTQLKCQIDAFKTYNRPEKPYSPYGNLDRNKDRDYKRGRHDPQGSPSIDSESSLRKQLEWFVRIGHRAGVMTWATGEDAESVTDAVYAYIESLNLSLLDDVVKHFSSSAVSSVPVKQGDFRLDILRGQFAIANCYSLAVVCAVACEISGVKGYQLGLTDHHVGLLNKRGMFIPMSNLERENCWAKRGAVKASLFQLIASLPIYVGEYHSRMLTQVGASEYLDVWTQYIAAGLVDDVGQRTMLRWAAAHQVANNVAQLQHLIWLITDGEHEARALLSGKLVVAAERGWRLDDEDLISELFTVLAVMKKQGTEGMEEAFWAPLKLLGVDPPISQTGTFGKRKRPEEWEPEPRSLEQRTNAYSRSYRPNTERARGVEAKVPESHVVINNAELALVAARAMLATVFIRLSRRLQHREKVMKQWELEVVLRSGERTGDAASVDAKQEAKLAAGKAGLVMAVAAVEANHRIGRTAMQTYLEKARPWVMVHRNEKAREEFAFRWIKELDDVNLQEGNELYR